MESAKKTVCEATSWASLVVLTLSLALSTAAFGRGAKRHPTPPVPDMTMDQWFSQQELSGHRLTPLYDGPDLKAARVDILAAAQRSVYISGYAVNTPGDHTWEPGSLFPLLCQKAQEGKDVRILADHRGSYDLPKVEKRLRDCGVKIIYYAPMSWGLAKLPFILHEKLMIIDGETVILGGSGYGEHYNEAGRDSGKWYDMDMKVEGPAACRFQRKFADSWARSVKLDKDSRQTPGSGPMAASEAEYRYSLRGVQGCEERSAPGGGSHVVPLHNNPLWSGSRPLLDAYLRAIHSTHDGGRIRLLAPYFTPTPPFTAALVDAIKNHHIQVDILTNSPTSQDEHDFVVIGTYYMAQKILRAGGHIWMWDTKATMHRKGGIFDDRWAVFGSDNLDNRGQEWSSESIVVTDDAEVIRSLNAEMDADHLPQPGNGKPHMHELTKKEILDHFNSTSDLEKLGAAWARWMM
ncbi:MAG TPA: phosphatidylserine/phosphatidylglycerophosphate/cardiolipin synthase family protein [Bdellovibrionota bacterium]|nr:phosphatidylserine/phosphatidylglycerophosphate/cardiolipin synthase family protein [Bdellovibrionota bacterium]